MLSYYTVNQQGSLHIDRGVPCQDSYAVSRISDTAIVAAVADGLGSESCSDIGSEIASRVAVDYCHGHYLDCNGDEEVLSMIRAAYSTAYDAVLDKAFDMDEPAGEFDSTLCLAILDGDRLFWGQSGDSGLIAAMRDGSYAPITRMQRDDYGHVYPLCFDDRWEFGICDGVASLVLCTDGILENLKPSILSHYWDNPIDTRLARMFLHPQPGDTENLQEVEQAANQYFENFPTERCNDDKTLIAIFDEENPPGELPAPYYDGPDWDEIDRRFEADPIFGKKVKDAAPSGSSEAVRANEVSEIVDSVTLEGDALTHASADGCQPSKADVKEGARNADWADLDSSDKDASDDIPYGEPLNWPPPEI